MKRLFIPALILTGLVTVLAWWRGDHNENPDRPKIVVGLMVDQMRWDYLYKYSERYGEGGIKRLLREGFTCENTLIRHAPTVTAAGHASVYTGSVPAINGIIENSWYDREWGRKISNVEDTTVSIIGMESLMGRSPRNLLSTTIGDELRIATQFQSKVVGVAIKDRGAILPAGHSATGAFWRENSEWVTSTYYMDALPGWVQDFNEIDWIERLYPDGWNTLFPIETYTLSSEDDKSYENAFTGEEKPVFPHTEASVSQTPFGNTVTFEFSKAAIEGYGLGEGDHTDMITISLSSPDKIGHRFGPNSIEVEDNYLRLDRDLEDFFNYLDDRYGRNGYLFFITADHGVNQSPGYLEENKLPFGFMDKSEVTARVEDALKKRYGVDGIILSETDNQVYLDYGVLDRNGLDKREVALFISDELKKESGIQNAFPTDMIEVVTLPERIRSMVTNGFHAKRGGDVFSIRTAGYKWGSRNGASHSDWYPFDAHIPLVWMGHGIPRGHTHRTVGMTDIAPTLAALLKVQMPSGSIGEVITEITDFYQ